MLLLLIGMLSLYFNFEIKNTINKQKENNARELDLAGQLESFLIQSLIDAQYYVDAPYDSIDNNKNGSFVDTESIKRKIQLSLQGLNFSLKRIDDIRRNSFYYAIIDSNVKNDEQVFAKLKDATVNYNSLIQKLINYDTVNFKESRQFFKATVTPYFRHNVSPLVDQYGNVARANMNEQLLIFNNKLSRYRDILLGVIVSVFFVSMFITYRLYRSIVNPIQLLSQGAQRVHDGTYKPIHIKSNDEIGSLGQTLNMIADGAENTSSFKDSIGKIIGSMRDLLIITDANSRITKLNPAALQLLDYQPDELIGEPLAFIFEDKDLHLAVDGRANSQNYETQLVSKNGVTVPVNLSQSKVYDDTGKLEHLVYVARDITEHKEVEQTLRHSLQKKETLLSEIHHRVKNNLAVISGLLQIQRWETNNEEAQAVLEDSQLRVKSIALVHEKLYQSEHLSSIKFDRYVEALVQAINQTFKNSNTDINFVLDIEPLIFNANQAIPCSLLLNELVVNIHKHAFNNCREGQVSIKIWKEQEKIHLHVRDNGSGLHDSNTENSFGMSLIETLVAQLNGNLHSYDDDGAVFEVTFAFEQYESV